MFRLMSLAFQVSRHVKTPARMAEEAGGELRFAADAAGAPTTTRLRRRQPALRGMGGPRSSRPERACGGRRVMRARPGRRPTPPPPSAPRAAMALAFQSG